MLRWTVGSVAGVSSCYAVGHLVAKERRDRLYSGGGGPSSIWGWSGSYASGRDRPIAAPTFSLSNLLPGAPDWRCSSILAGVVATNVAVFAAWRVPLPPLQRFLARFATLRVNSSPASVVGSLFSHTTPMHLGANMFVLYTVAGPLERRIGPEATWTTFAASGIAAAYASTAFKIARGIAIPSLGASGGVAGLLAAIAVIEPDAQFALIFLPMFTFPAKAFLPAVAALEVVGMVRGWRMMDHAAHLGGLCWGAASTTLIDRKKVYGTR